MHVEEVISTVANHYNSSSARATREAGGSSVAVMAEAEILTLLNYDSGSSKTENFTSEIETLKKLEEEATSVTSFAIIATGVCVMILVVCTTNCFRRRPPANRTFNSSTVIDKPPNYEELLVNTLMLNPPKYEDLYPEPSTSTQHPSSSTSNMNDR